MIKFLIIKFQSRIEELPRWSKIVEEFEQNYDAFLKLVDPVLLDSLKERRQIILKKWDTLSNQVVKMHRENLALKDLDEVEVKQRGIVGELDEWLVKAESFLGKLSGDNVVFNDEEIFELQVIFKQSRCFLSSGFQMSNTLMIPLYL